MQGNDFENVICKLMAILSQPQHVNTAPTKATAFHHMFSTTCYSWLISLISILLFPSDVHIKQHLPVSMGTTLLLFSNMEPVNSMSRVSSATASHRHTASCLQKGHQLSHRVHINSSSPGQNGCHFTDDIFRCIFVNDRFCILIEISLKCIPKCSIDNNKALV